MPTYIALLNWTQQGASKIGGSAKRLDAGRKAFKKAGAEIKDVCLRLCRLMCGKPLAFRNTAEYFSFSSRQGSALSR